MNKLIIRNGSVIAPSDGYHGEILDIKIEAGRITEIGERIEDSCAEIIDAQGCIVSAGFIDIHTHCFPTQTAIGVDADVIGVQRGSTAVLDAGSVGPNSMKAFVNDVVHAKKTKVFALMNVSKDGLKDLNELNDLGKIDEEAVRNALKEYGAHIVGFKARASSSVVGELGIIPIEIAVRLANEHQRILMIHTGNFPPHLCDVLNIMRKGDVLTHAYHGKEGGILDPNKGLIKEALAARERGVLFDVGHGSASFSIRTFLRARELGFEPDFVSTDLHIQNFESLVYSQHAVITKLINLGESLETMIDCASARPADHFGLTDLGHLRVGSIGDISISKLIDVEEMVHDSMGQAMRITKQFYPVKTIVSRESSECIENT